MVIALALVSAGVAPGVTSAQDGDNASTTTATAVPDSGNASTMRADLGAGVTLVDLEKQPGQIVLVLHAEQPATMLNWQDSMGAMKAANERGGDDLSAVDMDAYQYRIWLDRGRQRVVLDVETWRGASTISVWTTQKQFVISTDLPSRNPFGATSSTGGWLGGFGVAVCMVSLAAWKHKRNPPQGVRDLE
ncbi:hypothetical protein SAMN05192554_110120 [Haloarchaeobius iranensis]|uniref:Uncharacterized protein n=2 Tax=Haloarchaeobius iranensis TaxID=996166 RepID=A0A1G9XI40_9EURY|nr:hypothetical protein SAMN05192554_110120 [Haloarchaeobius iranensis]